MGYNEQIIINSRKGFNFFDRDYVLNFKGAKVGNPEDFILSDLNFGEYDFMAFDAEIMPWSYKSDILTIRDFTIPGEAAYLRNKWAGFDNTNEKVSNILYSWVRKIVMVWSAKSFSLRSYFPSFPE